MAGWRTASVWMKVALVCLSIALVVFVIGFATVAWTSLGRKDGIYTSYDYGLWRYRWCKHSRCDSTKVERLLDVNYLDWKDWYRATQAMECLGLICMVVATFILFLYFFVAKCKRRNALLAIILFTFASVLFIVIGVAIFASKFDDLYGHDVGWSMGLAIAAAILAFIAGVMEVLEIK